MSSGLFIGYAQARRRTCAAGSMTVTIISGHSAVTKADGDHLRWLLLAGCGGVEYFLKDSWASPWSRSSGLLRDNSKPDPYVQTWAAGLRPVDRDRELACPLPSSRLVVHRSIFIDHHFRR
jgi:hypothetical protein